MPNSRHSPTEGLPPRTRHDLCQEPGEAEAGHARDPRERRLEPYPSYAQPRRRPLDGVEEPGPADQGIRPRSRTDTGNQTEAGEAFDKVIATNLRIIAFSSSVLAKSFPSYGPYIASKAGVEGLLTQIERVLSVNNLHLVSTAVVDAARDSLVIGPG